MTQQEEANLGVAARQVLDNPAFTEAMQRVKDAQSRAWRNCDLRDVEGQKLLLQQAKVTDQLFAALVGLIEGGKMAQSKLDEKTRMDELRDENIARRALRRVGV